jgi:hypothetical protein
MYIDSRDPDKYNGRRALRDVPPQSEGEFHVARCAYCDRSKIALSGVARA